MLVFTEALIYQTDEENELLAKAGQLVPGHTSRGEACPTTTQALVELVCEECRLAGEVILEAVLRQEGLFSDAVAAELALVCMVACVCCTLEVELSLALWCRARRTGPQSVACVQRCRPAHSRGVRSALRRLTL